MNSFLIARFSLLVIVAGLLHGNFVNAQNVRKKTITRIFWQDRETQKLSYADLQTTNKWHIKRGWVQGFPSTLMEGQTLGPIVQKGKQVFVGLVGEQSNTLYLIDSGVYERPHGNHFHWEYPNTPSTKMQLNLGGRFDFAAMTNNYSFISVKGAEDIRVSMAANSNSNVATKFNSGRSNGAIAIVNDSLAYASWADTDGENAGRVDVSNPSAGANGKSYSFQLPAGGIVATCAVNGKVFFANSQGVSWVQADLAMSKNGQDVSVANVVNATVEGLGGVPEKLVVEKDWVLFSVSNENGDSYLFMIDSRSQNPSVMKLAIPVEKGMALSAPKTKLSLGKRYAFLFQERVDAASDLQEKLTIVDLDPNRDSSFNEAMVKANMNVGPSKIEGRFGHHDICFDAYGRFGIFTEPADGIVNIMTLNDMKVRARFKVGGVPDRIVAVGAAEHFH